MEQPRYHLEGIVHQRAETIEDFDGPLDVIFLLLSKNKIAIEDVSITSILEQYLSYLDEMKRMDVEIASEFTAMASHLMLIKTKMLLSAAEQEEAMTEMELLIQSLEQRQRKEAYEQIKTVFSYLSQRNEIGLGLFTKEQEPYQKDMTYRYEHDAQDLLDAFAIMQERSERLLPPPASNFAGIVGTEPYPVTTKAAHILKKLLSHKVLKFFSLFKGSKSRSEIVATFLAILELCKLKSISVDESETEDSISVTYLKMPDETVAQQES